MSTNAQKRIAQTRSALAFFLVGSFVGSMLALTFRIIPPDNKDLLTYILGQLSGMALLALGFYFSRNAAQDSQDDAQRQNTAKLTEAVTSMAPDNTTPPEAAPKSRGAKT